MTRPCPATDQFVDRLRGLAVRLPLRLDDGEIGSIMDDSGACVLQVDAQGERDDAQVSAIAAELVAAVNSAGGFRPQIRETVNATET